MRPAYVCTHIWVKKQSHVLAVVFAPLVFANILIQPTPCAREYSHTKHIERKCAVRFSSRGRADGSGGGCGGADATVANPNVNVPYVCSHAGIRTRTAYCSLCESCEHARASSPRTTTIRNPHYFHSRMYLYTYAYMTCGCIGSGIAFLASSAAHANLPSSSLIQYSQCRMQQSFHARHRGLIGIVGVCACFASDRAVPFSRDISPPHPRHPFERTVRTVSHTRRNRQHMLSRNLCVNI